VNNLKRRLRKALSKGEEAQTYAYGGGGLVLVVIVVLLILLLR